MNLLGSADIGVSMLLLISRFAACGFVLIGGAGLANGLGGPWAPADSSAPALGEGGGNTTPCVGPCCCWPPFPPPGLPVGTLDSSPGPESAVTASSPDCSLGICTFSFGLDWLADRCGGAIICGGPIIGVLDVRCGG